MYVSFFEDLKKEDVNIAGGKGANLGELTQAGIPVPKGFVITSETYKEFMESTGIQTKVLSLLEKLDVNDNAALQKASKDIKKIIIETEIPDAIQISIVEAYNALCGRIGIENAFVAIRSSATAEDLPEASFAGQQDTFLNIKGIDAVIEYVKKCWASLYEARAIFYREENNFDHDKVFIAVVVQQMVEAEKAGVMFTVHPSTGEDIALIEGSWGLGEAVVSGTVTPDNYVVDKKTEKLLNFTIAEKNTMFIKESDAGNTIQVDVPEDKKNERVLSDEDLTKLVQMGKRIQAHYEAPQDTEWAFQNGELNMLQSRPITTLGDIKEDNSEELEMTIITKGLGASPGQIAGTVKIIREIDELDKIQNGDILVTTMTTPDMVPAMKRANGIITDEGGVTCHAAIISRELGIPCVVGTADATTILSENQVVTIDGKKGLVYDGKLATAEEPTTSGSTQVIAAPATELTATEVKVNVSMVEATEKARATDADGVGLLRTEHMMLASGVHPKKFILDGKEDELIKIIYENVLIVADAFYPRPVCYRTLDAPTDEFQTLEGGEDEPHEHNPMLGWRGLRRELEEPEILKAEFKAIKKLVDQGYTNMTIMLPLLQHPDELKQAKALATEVGLIPHKDIEFGMMVETPASAIIIEDFIEVGLDFISFGTNDLTQYTLAVDRNNELVANLYKESHPAVLKLIKHVITKCNEAGVATSVCGQAGSVPAIVEQLVELGITGVSANTDAVADVRKTVARAEKKLLLNAARKQL